MAVRDPIKNRQANAKWRAKPENKEKARINSANWYASNRARGRTKAKLYYENGGGRARQATRSLLPDVRVRRYAADCRRNKRTWSLPERLAVDLITDNCFYCGVAPDPLNGIDRVDNSIGYVETNVVTACRLCNRMKGSMPVGDFVAHIRRAGSFLGPGLFY